MPLNPYNDAVGPMAKSVRELALVLDQVTGSDPEDPVTRDAGRHIDGSFTAALQSASLAGRADRRAAAALRRRHAASAKPATLMARVVKELEAAGAVVVDVEIADLDAALPGGARAAHRDR